MAESRRSHSGVVANTAAVALILALVAGALIWQKPWAEEPKPADAIPADAGTLLEEQFDALSAADSRAEFAKAAGSGTAARRFASDVWDARQALGISGVEFSYQRGGTVADRADGSASALVDVRWAGSDRSPWGVSKPSDVPVRFRVVPRDARFDIVAATADGANQLPPWLAGKATVRAAGGAAVLTFDGGSRGVQAEPLARTAYEKVLRMWPGASPRLCVIVPRSQAGAGDLVGHTTKSVRQLAAITTPVGETGAAVVVNPSEWVSMDRHAQQIVMTHEAVHAMTGTVGRQVNTLVAEGFADYIALYGDKRPLSVSAGQILRRVKASGAPKKLPSSADFDESADGLGAVYESAWMLFRMLGEQFGNDAVIRFYRLVLDGSALEAASQQTFGLTVDDLTQRWRNYLTKSASTVS